MNPYFDDTGLTASIAAAIRQSSLQNLSFATTAQSPHRGSLRRIPRRPNRR
jgi:hypothetical protein